MHRALLSAKRPGQRGAGRPTGGSSPPGGWEMTRAAPTPATIAAGCHRR